MENCVCYAIELSIKKLDSCRKLSLESTVLTPKIPLYGTMVDL
jgi:hypothetical protein